MKKLEVIKAWGRILSGSYPSLSIEITRECPLRCPGCYAYEPEHLHEVGELRSLVDFKGDDLVENVLALVKRHKPLHLSIVGGEPLVRFRELNELLPKLGEMGIVTQLVTSAVREIPKEWANIPGLYVVVSIDGLQPEHDIRRKPATYERILRHIQGHEIVVHCTIVGQTASQPGYYEKFLEFWSAVPEVRKIWFSLFTPQIGAVGDEIIAPDVKIRLLDELRILRKKFPKFFLPDSVIRGYLEPPRSPAECIFAKTTLNVTADLKNRITPCQFGGEPDCSQCGCMASAGLAAVGSYKLFGQIPLVGIYNASDAIGGLFRKEV